MYVSCLYLLYVQLQADQSGTIAEILAEDGKPVSVDTVLSLNHLISYRYELYYFFALKIDLNFMSSFVQPLLVIVP